MSTAHRVDARVDHPLRAASGRRASQARVGTAVVADRAAEALARSRARGGCSAPPRQKSRSTSATRRGAAGGLVADRRGTPSGRAGRPSTSCRFARRSSSREQRRIRATSRRSDARPRRRARRAPRGRAARRRSPRGPRASAGSRARGPCRRPRRARRARAPTSPMPDRRLRDAEPLREVALHERRSLRQLAADDQLA